MQNIYESAVPWQQLPDREGIEKPEIIENPTFIWYIFNITYVYLFILDSIIY